MAETKRRYAENTTVPEAKSASDIEQILAKYGAQEFARGWGGNAVYLAFSKSGRRVRIVLQMPDDADPAFTRTKAGYLRAEGEARKLYEQERRRRWRSLYLVVKANLEAVETGIQTFEEAFFGWLVLPNGQTLAEWFAPQLDRIYESGALPPMLPGLPPAEGDRRHRR